MKIIFFSILFIINSNHLFAQTDRVHEFAGITIPKESEVLKTIGEPSEKMFLKI